MVCNKIEKDIKENQSSDSLYLDFYDKHKDCYFRLFGIFMCHESQMLEEINLILIKSHSEYLDRIREVLENEHLTKIVFYSQKHAKILYKSMNINLKVR